MGCETTDTLFKENLAEWIYDDRKLVTYQYLSVALGVNVNLAKQMLYQFYEEEKAKKEKNAVDSKRRVYALYYVSGTTKSDSGDVVWTATICRDDNLEAVTKKFSTLSSVHVYAVGTIDMSDNSQDSGSVMKMLSKGFREMSTTEPNVQEASSISLGPFKTIVPKTNPIASTSSSPVAVKSEDNAKPEAQSTVISKKPLTIVKPKPKPSSPWTAAAKAKSKPVPVSSVKKQPKSDDELEIVKSVPAKKPAATPFEGYKDVLDSDSESDDGCGSKSSPAPSPPPPPSPAKKKQRKRKAPEPASPPPRNSESRRRRIRVLSDSSDEEDSNVKTQNDSDEEDVKPTIRSNSYFTVSQSSEPAKKKRKTKVVTTQVMDEDGFLVTKREKVSESESEGEEQQQEEEEPQPVKKSSGENKNLNVDKTSKKKGKQEDEGCGSRGSSEASKSTKSDTKGPGSSSSSSNTSPPLKKSTAPKKSSSKSGGSGPKTKQLTMTSFFTKKT